MCIVDQVPFEIPDSWEWVRLGSVCEIARGGSPRPIKQYLTESPDGINWIKIGDTDKDSKYIRQLKAQNIPVYFEKENLYTAGSPVNRGLTALLQRNGVCLVFKYM